MKIDNPNRVSLVAVPEVRSENEFDLDIREFSSQMPANLANGPQVGTPLTITTTVSIIKYTLLLKC